MGQLDSRSLIALMALFLSGSLVGCSALSDAVPGGAKHVGSRAVQVATARSGDDQGSKDEEEAQSEHGQEQAVSAADTQRSSTDDTERSSTDDTERSSTAIDEQARPERPKAPSFTPPSSDGPFEIGDVGPAGGFIFFVDEKERHDWTYLEVAPASLEWEDKAWSPINNDSHSGDPREIGTGTDIGDGAANTAAIVQHYEDLESSAGETEYAAKLCNDLEYGDHSDWFLPSREEIFQLYSNLRKTEAPIGDLDGLYWSSSESDSYMGTYLPDSTDLAWFQYFIDSVGQYPRGQAGTGKDRTLNVRAVRAF